AQSGLFPSNCRLLDATEAMVTGTDDGRAHVLLIAFESADHPLDAWITRAIECVRDHGGLVDDDTVTVRSAAEGERGGAAAAARNSSSGRPSRRRRRTR